MNFLESNGELEHLRRQVEQLTQAFAHNFSVYADIMSQLEARQACLVRISTEMATGKIPQVVDGELALEEYMKEYYAMLGLSEFLKEAAIFEEDRLLEDAPQDDSIVFGGLV